MVNMNFVDGMRNLGFRREMEGTFNLTGRSKGCDNDCSDGEHDEDFYENHRETFVRWAKPIAKEVQKLAKKHSVNIKIETSVKNGTIDVVVEKRLIW